MADFVTKHKKNVRFSVNRSEKIFIKLSSVEKETWLDLVKVLQDRRNTGTQVDTFVYLVNKKYTPSPKAKIKKNDWGTVERFSGVLFKLSADELKIWKARVHLHGGSQVECFNEMVDREYAFQDNIEIINPLR